PNLPVCRRTRVAYPTMETNCLQNSQGSEARDLCGQLSMFPSRRHMSYSRQVVDFLWPNLVNGRQDAVRMQQISIDQMNFIVEQAPNLADMLVQLAVNETPYLVVLIH